MSHIDQSTPSLKTPRPVGQDALEYQRDSVFVYTTKKQDSIVVPQSHQKLITCSNSSLKVPVRDITSPNYSSRQHTEGMDYQSISTSSMAEAKALAVYL